MPFLHINSSKITLFTAENCISNIADKIIIKLNTVKTMYKARGLNMDVFHGGNEFNLNYLIENIRPSSLNICAKGQHITIINWSIQHTRQGEC